MKKILAAVLLLMVFATPAFAAKRHRKHHSSHHANHHTSHSMAHHANHHHA
jgi:predicted S18 family serine protease